MTRLPKAPLLALLIVAGGPSPALGARANFHRVFRRYAYPEEDAPPALAQIGVALPPRFLSARPDPVAAAPAPPPTAAPAL